VGAPGAAVPLTALTEEQRRQAQDRFAVLRPYLEEQASLSHAARQAGVPLRTAQRWLRHYRQHGLAGLARPPRHDRGRRRLPDPLVRLIEGLALRRPPPSVAGVHRQVTTVARERGWPVPSYGRVYDIVRHLDPGLVTLAHEGAKAYKEAFDLLYRHEAAGPNATWQADHTPLDLWILDEHGQPARRCRWVVLRSTRKRRSEDAIVGG
jgi:putative transposase